MIHAGSSHQHWGWYQKHNGPMKGSQSWLPSAGITYAPAEDIFILHAVQPNIILHKLHCNSLCSKIFTWFCFVVVMLWVHTEMCNAYIYVSQSLLTHWGWVMHIFVRNVNIIGSDNDLAPGWCQAINWINDGILLIWTSGTNFIEISIEINTFSLNKMHFKISSGKWWPFCLGLNVSRHIYVAFRKDQLKSMKLMSLYGIAAKVSQHQDVHQWLWYKLHLASSHYLSLEPKLCHRGT